MVGPASVETRLIAGVLSPDDQEHPRDEGVFLSEQFMSDRLLLREADVRTRVANHGLGAVALVNEISEIGSHHQLIRHHQLFTMEAGGYKQAAWVTEPTNSESGWPKFNLFHFPGLGENVETGVGFAFHAGLAREFPEAQVVSVANNGMGRHSGRFSPLEVGKFRLDAMAEQRSELIRALDGRVPNVLVGTSLGTIINNKILNLDIDRGKELNVAGVVHYDPALVNLKRVPVDLGLRFLPEMIVDGTSEIALRTPVHRMLGALMLLASSARERPSNFGAMGVQAAGVLRGTPIHAIKRVLDNYTTAVIAGEKDPASQLKMWQELSLIYSSLFLRVIERRGHGMALNPLRAAHKIAKTIHEMGILN